MAGVSRHTLIHRDQKWYHLSTILSGSLPFPVIIVGNQVAAKYGAGTAICSILVGNLILWLIGICVMSMTMRDRSNAIQNVKSYLGKYGAIAMWLILMSAILNWFARQIAESAPSIALYFSGQSTSAIVRIGAAFGLFTTLLATGGIRLIKIAVASSFPFIFCYYLFAIFRSNFSISQIEGFSLSLPAIIMTISTLVPGIINLPTLFRHASSKEDCFLGLSLLMILISFFEISTIWMKFSNPYFTPTGSINSLFSIATLLFLVLTLIYINLINIYYGSACWETYVPRFEGPKGYAVIGLMGTAVYTFLQIQTPFFYILNLTDCFLASLGVALLIGYLIRIIVQHRPRKFEKAINGFCWLIGCVVSTIFVIQNVKDLSYPLVMGAAGTTMAFLVVIFIEETAWAAKKLIKQHAASNSSR
jgi:purine-cytosine permease-like protein